MSEFADVRQVARQRAFNRLAIRHADEFRELLDRERQGLGLPPARPRIAECGTRSGAQRHYRRGETPCDACREAENAYQRQRNAGRT